MRKSVSMFPAVMARFGILKLINVLCPALQEPMQISGMFATDLRAAVVTIIGINTKLAALSPELSRCLVIRSHRAVVSAIDGTIVSFAV